MNYKEFQRIMEKEIKNLTKMSLKHEQSYAIFIKLTLAKELCKLCKKKHELDFTSILKAYASFWPDTNLDKTIANTIKTYFLNQINEPAQ